MKAFRVTFPAYSDYELIVRNGLWSGPGTLGYEQDLRKLVAGGRVKPADPKTILAELYSPYVDDFLHGLDREVPFLCSERAMKGLSGRGLAGLRFGPVEVVKIATKGRGPSRKLTGKGEPEDLIEKPSNKIGDVPVPRLYAVHVTGTLDVQPDKDWTGNARYTPAFSLPQGREGTPDLWRPRVAQELVGGWTFCSQRFRQTVEEPGLTNIRFIPFAEFMQSYREKGH
jgi:hypothetical protein